MRMSYITEIQKCMPGYIALKTNRTTSRLLDGSYMSVLKGRSMNFDELRDYVPGDDIKDMDWKASARSRKLLVRQYVAEKKHNVMFVFDTNRRMLGQTQGLEEKCQLALLSGGGAAYLVNRNGDYVSAVFASPKTLQYFPFKTGLGNIETILSHVRRATTLDNTTTVNTALDYILRNFRRKMLIVIVTDLQGAMEIKDETMKRLLVSNDLFFLLTQDVGLDGKKLYSVSRQTYLPAYFARDKKLKKRVNQKKEKLEGELTRRLNRLGVPGVFVNENEQIYEKLTELFQRKCGER